MITCKCISSEEGDGPERYRTTRRRQSSISINTLSFQKTEVYFKQSELYKHRYIYIHIVFIFYIRLFLPSLAAVSFGRQCLRWMWYPHKTGAIRTTVAQEARRLQIENQLNIGRSSSIQKKSIILLVQKETFLLMIKKIPK